ncbi:putative Zn finger protein [Murinocardiopsis flavida]|uniref:Putative Zn finger protein n=1 Tax=Murinocardiopsis flavida TaxID=645275 RepID=A0A2P8DP69_9ACTN|nr:SWIM zinc finger family protein [Murinocardiopsis flavida]PSK99005.1 putative Zn finger protein [Murinocardiopsis flavida]
MSGAEERPEHSWWSGRFVAALESRGDRARLQRGRGYARGNAVRDLAVREGEVTARVQGSRARPYRVSLIAATLDDDQWALATAALAAQPLFRAALLAGRLPPEVEEVFAVLGLPLFPRGPDDLVLTCSCPDWGHPCKHAAATLYVLAAQLDADPFLLFAWLGRDRAAFLAELRRSARTATGAAPGEGPATGDLAPPPCEPRPESGAPADFWDAPPLPVPAPPGPPRPPVLADLEPGGGQEPGGGPGLAAALEPLYAAWTGAVRQR